MQRNDFNCEKHRKQCTINYFEVTSSGSGIRGKYANGVISGINPGYERIYEYLFKCE